MILFRSLQPSRTLHLVLFFLVLVVVLEQAKLLLVLAYG